MTVCGENELPPVANLILDPTHHHPHDNQNALEVLEPVYFDGSNSYDPDGIIKNYNWDFGDRNHGTGVKTEHEYSKTGLYTVTLTVNDGKFNNTSSMEIIVISSTQHPPVAISGPDRSTNVSEIVVFDASSSYDPDGDTLKYIWNFGDNSLDDYGCTTTHIYDRDGIFKVTLTVKDYYHSKNDILYIKVGNGTEVISGGSTNESEEQKDTNYFMWITIIVVVVILILFALGWVHSKNKRKGVGKSLSTPTRALSTAQADTVAIRVTDKKPITTEQLLKTGQSGMSQPTNRKAASSLTAASAAKPTAGVKDKGGRGRPKGVEVGSKVQKPKGRRIDVDAYRKRLEKLEKLETNKREALLKKQLSLETKKMEKEMEKDLQDLGLEF